jgi:CubicO group peptidase (beta-lactamase class C family)
VDEGRLRAAALRVETKGKVFEKAFGKAGIDSPFLIASITKPMTAAGVMILVERGLLGFEDPAAKHLPGFEGDGREKITLRHLLTHTSGLPDMLPENEELRKRHAPLSLFVEGTLKTPLKFAPGTRTSYQSMGILLAAEIAARKTGKAFPDYLHESVYRPLGMQGTTLGLGKYRLEDTVPNQVEHADPPGGTPQTASWDWNSRYWRTLGAPWGGAHSTAADIAAFLKAFLHPAGRPFSAETARRMTVNQNAGLNQPYGIGWSLSPRPFGHGGSTGTMCWADASSDTTFVLLTSLPSKVSQKTILTPVSDAVRAALG